MVVLGWQEFAVFSEYRFLGRLIGEEQVALECDALHLPIHPNQSNGSVLSKTGETDYLRDNAFLFCRSGKTQCGLCHLS